jgi:hypothetical protein
MMIQMLNNNKFIHVIWEPKFEGNSRRMSPSGFWEEEVSSKMRSMCYGENPKWISRKIKPKIHNPKKS